MTRLLPPILCAALAGLVACAAEPEGKLVPCEGAQTSDWFAWNNLMPPLPNDFHVSAEVEVGNPGVVAKLRERSVRDAHIALELTLHQRPGEWAQQVTRVPVRFDKDLSRSEKYARASVLCGDAEIQALDVGDVH